MTSHIGERGVPAQGLGRTLSGWLSLALFILTIPLSNWVILHVGLVCPENGPCLIPVWPGLMAPSAVLLAGLSLVLRDLVHHYLGSRAALAAIAAGAALSGFVSEPALVIASVCAFFFAELADFAVYTPMRSRFPASAVLASGLAGSVVDSAIFLSLAFGSIEFLAGQVLGKFWMSLLAAGVILAVRRFRSSRKDEALSAALVSGGR